MRSLACTVAAVLLAAGCGPEAQHAGSASPAAKASGSHGRVVEFGEMGVEVRKPEDAAKLTGTSAEFKAFVVKSALSIERPDAPNCGGITVQKYDPAGFAIGGVDECGGYAAIWGKKDGRWKELIGTQDAWSCTELHKFGVPPTIVDKCVSGNVQRSYTG